MPGYSVHGGRKLRTQMGRRADPLLPDGGVTTTYQPDPVILRLMHEIDPNLDLEWRPNGQWWTSPMWNTKQMPEGSAPGCWRLIVRGKSGDVRGLMLWPPDQVDSRLIKYLRDTWAFERFIDRSHILTLKEKHWAKRVGHREFEKKRKEEKAERWASVDHGAMRRAVLAERNDAKWRGNWNVPVSLDGSA